MGGAPASGRIAMALMTRPSAAVHTSTKSTTTGRGHPSTAAANQPSMAPTANTAPWAKFTMFETP